MLPYGPQSFFNRLFQADPRILSVSQVSVFVVETNFLFHRHSSSSKSLTTSNLNGFSGIDMPRPLLSVARGEVL